MAWNMGQNVLMFWFIIEKPMKDSQIRHRNINYAAFVKLSQALTTARK